MRKFFASIAGLALLAGPAMAADLAPAPAPAYKMPVAAPAPALSWTGCYVNGGWGYSLYDLRHNTESFPGLVPSSVTGDEGGRGWLGEFGGGCDYQFTLGNLGNFVVGVLADYDFMDVHGGIQDAVTTFTGDLKESSAWLVGGRLGYLVTPNLLTYVDGGYTQTRFDQANLSSLAAGGPTTDFTQAHTFHGWFLGSGLEYALNFSWLPIHGLFWRNEYRYSSYNSVDLPVIAVATGLPTAIAFHEKPYVQTFTSSLIWKFN
jgi:outer membrane immunogenic protein